MVVSYNFHISNCNCSESVGLLSRVLHSMQQDNIRKILWSCQVPLTTHNQTLHNIPCRINFSELWVHLGNSGKFTPRENNSLYAIYSPKELFFWMPQYAYVYVHHTHLYNWSVPSLCSSTATFNKCYNELMSYEALAYSY